MSKVTKKDLNDRLLMVETLLGLHRALPEQISNDQANNAIFRMQCALSSGKELAERKPQLKQLNQSVFDGLDEKWRFAAVDRGGLLKAFTYKPKLSVSMTSFILLIGNTIDIGGGYDASNWQNSLIERDIAKELTGSDLARAMLARGDKYVLCHLSQTSEESAKDVLGIAIGRDHSGFRVQRHNSWQYAVPINNQGEPLTASEAGL